MHVEQDEVRLLGSDGIERSVSGFRRIGLETCAPKHLRHQLSDGGVVFNDQDAATRP
jgi:hypothetical protein